MNSNDLYKNLFLKNWKANGFRAFLAVLLTSMAMFALSLMVPSIAKADHNVTNGCGSGSTRAFTPQGIFANFTPACNNHDRCYGTLGQSKVNCDNIFYNQMIDRCESTYSDVWEIPSREACYATANGYYEAVRRAGGDAYRGAQAHARQELEDPTGARYALLCIHNETNIDVNYRFKWGTDSWKDGSIDQGSYRYHWIEYAYRGENRSPDFHIDFDYSLIANQYLAKDYVLPRTAAHEQDCYEGSQYEFSYTDNSHRYIDLYQK